VCARGADQGGVRLEGLEAGLRPFPVYEPEHLRFQRAHSFRCGCVWGGAYTGDGEAGEDGDGQKGRGQEPPPGAQPPGQGLGLRVNLPTSRRRKTQSLRRLTRNKTFFPLAFSSP